MEPLLSSGDIQTAWIDAPGRVRVYATAPRLAPPLQRAIPRLIYGISHQFGDERLRWLRRPIHLTDRPTDFEFQMIKVCAKRFQAPTSESATPPPDLQLIDVTTEVLLPEGFLLTTTNETFQDAGSITRQLHVASEGGNRPLYRENQPIIAMLLDHHDRAIAITRNTNLNCRLFHAEINLVEYLRMHGYRHFPEGSRLYITVKPCRMCAAAILDFCGSSYKVPIFTLKDQPGVMSKHHLLTGHGICCQSRETQND